MAKKEMTHTAAHDKLDCLMLEALPFGGFTARTRTGGYEGVGFLVAAFSTLDELLGWVKANAGRPGKIADRVVGDRPVIRAT